MEENSVKSKKRINISLFVGVTFSLLLLITAYLGISELSNTLKVKSIATITNDEKLPELLEYQKTLANIESLRRLAEVINLAENARMRRNFRINAQALSAETQYNKDATFTSSVREVSDAIVDLSRLRDSIDNIKNRTLKNEKAYYSEVKSIIPKLSEYEIKSKLFKILGLMPIENPLSFILEKNINISNKIKYYLNDKSNKYSSDDKKIIHDLCVYLDNSEKIHNKLTSERTAKDNLANKLLEKIDFNLRVMRDNVTKVSELSFSQALKEIEEVSTHTVNATISLFVVLSLILLLFSIVTYYVITKPLRWTSITLKNIREGKFKVAAPKVYVKEIYDIVFLIEEFSEHLSELYSQTSQMKEDVNAKKDLEQIMKAVFAASLDGYLVWDKDNIIDVSNSLLRLLDLRDKEAFTKGYKEDWFGRHNFDTLYMEMMYKGYLREEIDLFTHSGFDYPFEVTYIPVRLHDRTSILTYMRDLRERRQGEKILKDAKDQAEAANKIKSEFLANMSHEIRTPMNAIIGMSYLISQTNLSHQQVDYVNKINSAGNALLGIVNDILDYSKIEAGKASIEHISANLEDVFNTLTSIVIQRCREKNIILIIAIDPDVPAFFVGDPLKLGQVILNIVSNSIKFTEKGSIRINCSIVKTGNENEAYLNFSVKDTGIGMNEEQKARLFTAFSQADNSVTRKYGGTGLGLSISKGLVHLMGGNIYLESEPNKGTETFFDVKIELSNDEYENNLESNKELKSIKSLLLSTSCSSCMTLIDFFQRYAQKLDVVTEKEKIIHDIEQMYKQGSPYRFIFYSSDMEDMSSIINKVRNKYKEPPFQIIMAMQGDIDIIYGREIKPDLIIIRPLNPFSLKRNLIDLINGNAGTLNYHKIISSKPMFKGAKVLVVEDNKINQQVALEIIAELGINVSIADNGVKALSILENESDFDLILMDLQMPEMDGYTATKNIKEDERTKKIPVVAMTAHTMSEEKDKCYEIGMEDYIIKPFRIEDLYDVLCKKLRNKLCNSTSDTDTIEDVHSEDKVELEGDIVSENINILSLLKNFNTTVALDLMAGNEVLYLSFLRNFWESYRIYIPGFEKMYNSRNFEMIGREAHTIKGLSGNLGSDELTKISFKLEKACKGGDALEIEVSFNEFITEFKNVIRDLEKVFGEV